MSPSENKEIFGVLTDIKVKMATIETTQILNHKENNTNIKKLFKIYEHVSTNPCRHHGSITTDIKRLYVWVWGIVILTVGVAIRSLWK